MLQLTEEFLTLLARSLVIVWMDWRCPLTF